MSKEEMSTIEIKRVKASSIYRLLLIGLGIPLGILSFIYGVLGCFGYDTVAWNNEPVHGLLALPVGLLTGLVVTVIITFVMGSLACLGLWIYSRFRRLEIKVISND